MRRLIIGFNGHGQSARTRTGIGKLLKSLGQERDKRDTWLFAWRHDTPTLAVWISNTRPQCPISIIGYSYGGYTAVLLCRELRRMGLKVDHLYLIDAVARKRPKIGAIRSLLDRIWWVEVPNNVKQVVSWRQQFNKPSGHKIVVNSRTTEFEQTFLYVPHSQMDDCREIHARILADLT